MTPQLRSVKPENCLVSSKCDPMYLRQELADDLKTCAEEACPRLLQQASVCEYLTECVSQCCRQAQEFIRHTLLKDAGQKIRSMLG